MCLGADHTGHHPCCGVTAATVWGQRVSRELCSAAWPVSALGSDRRGLGSGAGTGGLTAELNGGYSKWGPWVSVRRVGLKLRVSRSFHGPTCLVLEQGSVQDTEEFFKEGNCSFPWKCEKHRPCMWVGSVSARGSSPSLSAELKSGTDATRCSGCSLGVCVDRRDKSGCFVLQTWLHISHSVYVEIDKLHSGN